MDLRTFDLSRRLPREEALSRLQVAQHKMLRLRLESAGLLDGSGEIGPPVLVLFEGWDASGKGGAIKRLCEPIDPRHVRVATFAAPTPDEKRHHFMLRFSHALPGWGGMAVLDRSWYGRVLVERVEDLASEDQWRRAYDEISNWEKSLADEGTVLVKIWLHLSPEQQLKRFREREKDPLKQWKITAEDWRNRERWDDYLQAAQDMIDRTDRSWAPWHVISGEDKRTARVDCLEVVNRAIEDGLRHWGRR